MEKKQLCDFLKKKVMFFSEFPHLQIEKISDKLTSEFFSEGSKIFLQGSIGNKMYIIVDGLVEVLI